MHYCYFLGVFISLVMAASRNELDRIRSGRSRGWTVGCWYTGVEVVGGCGVLTINYWSWAGVRLYCCCGTCCCCGSTDGIMGGMG